MSDDDPLRVFKSETTGDSVELALELKQKQILLYLLQRRKRIVTRTELYNAIWFRDPDGKREPDDNLISTQISLLRNGMADSAKDPLYIKTIPGQGLQFIAEVIEVRPPRFISYRRAIVLIGGLLFILGACAAGYWWFQSRKGPPVKTEVDAVAVHAYDIKRRLVWTFPFPQTPEPPPPPDAPEPYDRAPLLVDLNGDGKPRVLVAYWPTNPGREGTYLYCLNGTSGKLLWSQQAGRLVETTKGLHNSGVHLISRIRVLKKPTASGGRILVLSHDAGGGYTSMLQVLRGDDVLRGNDRRVVDEYLNPGWLRELELDDLDNDGKEEILLGGENDSFGANTQYKAELIVLHADRVSGQAPRYQGGCCYYKGPATGNEAALLLFPNLAPLPTPTTVYDWRVRQLLAQNGLINFKVSHSDHPAPDPNYTAGFRLDRHLHIESIQPDLRLASETLRKQAAIGIDANRVFIGTFGNVMVIKNDFESKR